MGVLVLVLEHVDVIQIARQAIKIKTKAYDKLFGNLKSHIVRLNLASQSFWLEEQSGHLQLGRLMGAKVVDELVDGVARVDDILHDNHRAALYVLAQAQDFLYGACALGARIRFQADKSDLSVHVHSAEKVAGKRKSAVKHTQKERELAGAVVRYLFAQFFNAGINLLASDVRLECEPLLADFVHSLCDWEKHKNFCKGTKKIA